MKPMTFGDRAADYLTRNMGCWLFIGIQTVIYAVWIVWNKHAPVGLRFDTQDLLVLNLGIGIFGNYAFSVLLMSQNRQSSIDRSTLNKDLRVELHVSKEVDTLRQELLELKGLLK